MSKDSMVALFELSEHVAEVLNSAHVGPTTDLCAILVIVASDDDPSPLGGSLNWDEEAQLWKVSLEAQCAEYEGEH